MKLHLSHRFSCSSAQMIQLMQRPEFSRRVARSSKVQQTVLLDEVRSGKHHRSLRCVPERVLPSLLQKAIGSKQLIYHQETVLDPIAQEVSWTIHPQGTGGRVIIRGLTTIREHTDGCERIISGNVQVKLPLIGAKIEAVVVADITRSFERAAAELSDWVHAEYGQ